jgi:hypothetical protein
MGIGLSTLYNYLTQAERNAAASGVMNMSEFRRLAAKIDRTGSDEDPSFTVCSRAL